MKKTRLKFTLITFLLNILCYIFMAFPLKAETDFAITKKTATLTAGKSFTFQATGNGQTADVTWSVSNNRATINQNGRLTAKKAGKVTVIATLGASHASTTLRIKGKKLIAIDPGHQSKGNPALEPVGPGAKTKKAKVASGTTGRFTGVPEYKLTLAVAKKLRRELINRGYEVVMTRTKHNVNISNKERALLANNSGADVCVRIHANGSTSTGTYGALALYPSSSNPYVSRLSGKSKTLSSVILKAMCKETGAKNLGPMVDDNLTGSNWSKIPVTVIEMGFMSNEKEDRLMQTQDYQNKLARGMAKGIEAYFK